jgi:hypothetical protein
MKTDTHYMQHGRVLFFVRSKPTTSIGHRTGQSGNEKFYTQIPYRPIKEWQKFFLTTFTWGRQQENWRHCCGFKQKTLPNDADSSDQRRENLRSN